jgi:hypothetical protein
MGALHIFILAQTPSFPVGNTRMCYFTFSEIDFACIISRR